MNKTELIAAVQDAQAKAGVAVSATSTLQRKSQSTLEAVLAQFAPKLSLEPIGFAHGAKVFSPVMVEAGVILCELNNIDAVEGHDAVLINGTSINYDRAIELLDEMWTDAYNSFKAWKSENREQRKAWYKTSEGRSKMLAAENQFLREACAKHFPDEGYGNDA